MSKVAGMASQLTKTYHKNAEYHHLKSKAVSARTMSTHCPLYLEHQDAEGERVVNGHIVV